MGNFISISCDATISRCLNCTINKVAYISELKENFDTLEAELQKLIEAKNDIMRRVVIAEQKQRKRTGQVQGWLSRVQNVEVEVGKLQEIKSQQIEKLCLGGYCSKSCKSSYEFGKDVSKKLQDVAKLMREGDFREVAERVPEDPVDEMLIDQPKIVGQKSIFDKVCRWLEEKEVGIIGLYGPGGVGKTTLLKQINNFFYHGRHKYDYVIWIAVSKEAHYEKIQEEIGKKLGLFSEPWKNRSLDDKAKSISKVLSNKKFVLLLDDIWKRIDLSEMGVRLPSLKNESKIILTTRCLKVCGKMKTDKSIRVECLGPEEAWELFQENLQKDILYSHPEIPGLAKIVANECGGIPLVLVTIGRAMACKNTQEEWDDAIQVLQRSVFEFSVSSCILLLLVLGIGFSHRLLELRIKSCYLPWTRMEASIVHLSLQMHLCYEVRNWL